MALLNQPPQGAVVNRDGTATPGWSPFFSAIFALLTAMTQSGTTAQRPTTLLWTGRMYYDTTLGLPIFYQGPGWVKADGTAA
jgi:hypothetical protein